MHISNPESTDILRGALWFISDPSLWRVRQNGKQFRVIDYVRHKQRLVLGVNRAGRTANHQCQRKEQPSINEIRWFHGSVFLAILGLRTRLTLLELFVKTLA